MFSSQLPMSHATGPRYRDAGISHDAGTLAYSTLQGLTDQLTRVWRTEGLFSAGLVSVVAILKVNSMCACYSKVCKLIICIQSYGLCVYSCHPHLQLASLLLSIASNGIYW